MKKKLNHKLPSLLLIFTFFSLAVCSPGNDEQSEETRDATDITEMQHTDSLAWPDTTQWKIHDLSIISPGLIFKLPDSIRIYAYKEGVTIFLTEDIIETIGIENEMNMLDFKKEREWLENSENRENLEWLIDVENEAYYTGLDLSAPEGRQITHSCYAKKSVAGIIFNMKIDGITIDGDQVYNLSQQQCLMLLSAFKTLNKVN